MRFQTKFGYANSKKLDRMLFKKTNLGKLFVFCRINWWEWGWVGGGMRFQTKIDMQIRRNWMGYV